MRKSLKTLAIIIPAVMLCIAGYYNFNELKYSAQLNQKIVEVSKGTRIFNDSGELANFIRFNDGTPDRSLRATEIMLDTQVKKLYLKHLDAKEGAATCWFLLILTALTFGGLLSLVTFTNTKSHEKN